MSRLPGSAWAALATALVAAGCPNERPADYYHTPRIGGPPVVTPASDASLAMTDAGAFLDEAGQGDAAATVTPADTLSPADAGAADAASSPQPDVADPTRSPNDRLLPSFVGLFRRLSPSVVNIYTQEVVRKRLVHPLLPPAPPERGTSLGSGLILDSDGHVVTNAHVVENAAEIRVRFRDGQEMPARLVGLDPVRDIALLKVDSKVDLEPVVPGDSDELAVGDWVIAIGNPLGLSHTLTKGIVSAKGRAELVDANTGYLDLIQTDVAINEGNSGGPLFNMKGEVVGIATAVSSQGQGISFAIPWNVVSLALPRLRQGGQVSRSWLGVFVRPANERSGPGVLVVGVVDDSPAARGGLHPGDVVVALDGRPIKDVSEFRLRVASGVAGTELPLTVARGGEELELSIRLEEARGAR